MNTKLDAWFDQATTWHDEMKALRTVVLGCHLTEELKWGKPCYTFQEGNVVIIQGFKNYCALLFFKGVLLNDPHGMLVKTGENTVVGRQIRFRSVDDVVGRTAILKEYIANAIEVERAGLKVQTEGPTELVIPEELQARLDDVPGLRAAFEGLTPGRRRAYVRYFAEPKQSKTRASRVEKYVPHILDGRGLDDR